MNRALEQAEGLIASGEVIAIPTETVYGLAADALNFRAVKHTFELKGRPPDNPLIVHISNTGQLDLFVKEFTEPARKLAKQFWPGPLTLILRKTPNVPDVVTAGLETVAVRMPDHPLSLALIEKTGPLTAPSANRSGRPSPTRPAHIREDFGDRLFILDGGTTRLGLESTVLDLSGSRPVILRPGFIPASQISACIGEPVTAPSGGDAVSGRKSPGTRHTHYKPRAAVSWLMQSPRSVQFQPGHYYIFHTETDVPSSSRIHSYRNNFAALARDLYDHFRTADHLSCSHILIERLPPDETHPLIPALKDRIGRAAE